MLLNKIKKTKNRFRAYPTHQAVQTSGSTADALLGFQKILAFLVFIRYFKLLQNKILLLFK